MNEEQQKKKGWKERHFFSLNLNPVEAMPSTPEDPPSYLNNPQTNPARYEEPKPNPEDEANAPKTPYPVTVKEATPLNPATEPLTESVADQTTEPVTSAGQK